MEEDMDNERLQHYMDIGAIEMAGVSEDGEIMYAINEEASEIAPELWQAHMQFIDGMLMKMYEDGYIKVEYNEDLEAEISMSDEGYEIAKNLGIIPMDMPEIPNN